MSNGCLPATNNAWICYNVTHDHALPAGPLTDTDPATERVLRDLLRQAPVWRKLQLPVQLNATGRALAVSDLRRRYPDADEAFIRRMLAERLLGRELAHKVLEAGGADATG